MLRGHPVGFFYGWTGSQKWVYEYSIKYILFGFHLLTHSQQLSDFEDILQSLSDRAANLKSLNIGCNPLSGGRPLSLPAALLSMSHIDCGRARDLFTGLEQVFSSVSRTARGEEEVQAAVRLICDAYANSRDCGRLFTVATMLLKIKLRFPCLEKVDEEKISFI